MLHFVEYGHQSDPVVLLFDNEGYLNKADNAEMKELRDKYHLIVPVLQGDFPADQVVSGGIREIEAFVQDRYQGSVYAICGLFGSWPLMRQVLAETDIAPVKTVVEEHDTTPGSFILAELEA